MSLVSLPSLVQAARNGQVVSFPTDTVPALAVRGSNAAAIFTLKNRPADKPLILMAAEPEGLWPFTMGSETEQTAWQALAAQAWPGALTLVLPASAAVPAAVNPGHISIGLRVPNHPVALSILKQTGPLATTSANRSGAPPLTDPQSVEATFPEIQVLAGWSVPGLGRVSSGQPSTVLRWLRQPEGQSRWQVLRQGALRIPGLG